MADNNIRYEITHDGRIVEGVTALSSNMAGLIKELFSQYGWKYNEINRQGTYRKIRVSIDSEKSLSINLFAGNIRNEKRNSYEKKIQLSKSDPRQYKDGITLILGFYVSNVDDTLKDAIVVGYPVDESVKYETNPSLRGVFVNDILIKAKENGMYIDEVRRTVGFRPEFLMYYLKNYSYYHQYTDGRYSSDDLMVLNDLLESFNMHPVGMPENDNSTEEIKAENTLYDLTEFIKNQDIIDVSSLNASYDNHFVELAIKTLEGEREILKFEDGTYISVRRLEKNGIGKAELIEYCNRIYDFSDSVKVFNANSLEWEHVCPEIEELGFGDEFYCSLLLSDSRFYRRIVEDIWFFSTKTDKFGLVDIISEYIDYAECVSVDELIRTLYERYGIDVDRNGILSKIKDSKMYYDKILDYIYKDYETYYEDV